MGLWAQVLAFDKGTTTAQQKKKCPLIFPLNYVKSSLHFGKNNRNSSKIYFYIFQDYFLNIFQHFMEILIGFQLKFFTAQNFSNHFPRISLNNNFSEVFRDVEIFYYSTLLLYRPRIFRKSLKFFLKY